MPSRHNSYSYDPYAQHEAELTCWLPETYTYGRRPSRSHRPSTSHGQARQDHLGMYYDPYTSSYHNDYNPYSLPPLYGAPSRSHSRARSRSPQRSTSTRRLSNPSSRRRSSTRPTVITIPDSPPEQPPKRYKKNDPAYGREYRSRPEVIAHKQEYWARPDVKERKRAYDKARNADPEYKERRRARREEAARWRF